MTKQIDKIRKAKYKASRLRGNSIRQGLRDAGYTEASASHSSGLGVVKCSEQELMDEIRASDISIEWVLNRLQTELAATDAKASDRIRIVELLGKYLKMFNDNNIQQAIVNINDTIDALKHRSTVDATTSQSKG